MRGRVVATKIPGNIDRCRDESTERYELPRHVKREIIQF